MRFERGKNPMDSMEVGLRAKAPIVYRILAMTEDVPSGQEEYVVGLPSSTIENILPNLKYHPENVKRYYVEMQDKEGRIFSGISPLSQYAGGFIKYREKYYFIPDEV